MDNLEHFGIPIYGIQFGLHHYEFELDNRFFEAFEDSPIQEGEYKARVECDKRENEFILNFSIEGRFQSACDRCLADIKVPSAIEKMIWVKYSNESHPGGNSDIIYLEETEHIFNVADLLYELVILSIPIVKRYDCDNDPNPKCDFKVLSYLKQENKESEKNSLADKFKDLRNL